MAIWPLNWTILFFYPIDCSNQNDLTRIGINPPKLEAYYYIPSDISWKSTWYKFSLGFMGLDRNKKIWRIATYHLVISHRHGKNPAFIAWFTSYIKWRGSFHVAMWPWLIHQVSMPWSCRWSRGIPSSAATSGWWSSETRRSSWMLLGGQSRWRLPRRLTRGYVSG